MGTSADKLDYLNDTKTAIKSAIIAKGQEVGDNDTFRSYADKILAIQSGSTMDDILLNVYNNGTTNCPANTRYTPIVVDIPKGYDVEATLNANNTQNIIITDYALRTNYQIRTAELPDVTINLYNSESTLIESKTTTALTGGEVFFNLDAGGTYTITAFDNQDTQLWTSTITLGQIGVYNVKSGKSLTNYTAAEIHTICQGGYFDKMFSLKDKWRFNQSGSILNGYDFFVADMEVVSGKNVVTFRLAKPYTSASYDVDPRFTYLENATATTFKNNYTSNGGYKYSNMRRRFQKAGEATWSQATSIKPDDSTITDGIPFSSFYYSDTNQTSKIYTYDPKTDTMNELSTYSYGYNNYNYWFVKGYFKSVGAITQATFEEGHYYTYTTSSGAHNRYGYTLADTYVAGTTYYGFYETLQEDGIFYAALSSLSSYLVRFSDASSTGRTNTTYTSITNDYVNIPSVEEETGINRYTTLFSGVTGTNAGAYNIAGEGSKLPAYDSFDMTATGYTYWTRSSNSYYNYYFCYIYNVGYIGNYYVYITYYVRVGFKIN